MAKKTEKPGKDQKSDEILDSLEKDVAADAGDSVDEPVAPAEGEGLHGWGLEFQAWPCDPDHRSARDVLLGRGAKDPSTVVLEDDFEKGGSALNLILLILFLGVAGVGIWQFRSVSSPEALAAKQAAREAMEKAHLEEQMAKQKKYGILRIESSPAQAVVYKDGEKIVTKKADTGEELVGKTPMNMMDLDISQTFQIKVELDGHEPFEFAVAPHLWTKDAASGEYKFIKMIELTPNVCEYWFLYDAKKRKEVQFPGETGKDDCTTHFDEATQQGVSVTECTCKIPPEGWTPPEKKGEKKDDKKDDKKGQ